jgi:hypothetical protein
VPIDGQRREEALDLVLAHLDRMPLVMEEDVPTYPADIRLLGPIAVVPGADGFAHQVEKSWLGGLCVPLFRVAHDRRQRTGRVHDTHADCRSWLIMRRDPVRVPG